MERPTDLSSFHGALAGHYSRFRVAERLLLTGHSHQAWPDRAFEGHKKAFDDAAELADEKWGRAFAVAERVRSGFRKILGDDAGDYALGPSTHDLAVRFLSALDFRKRPRIVTTEGEFHSLYRQLKRLAEEGVEVVFVPIEPHASFAERVAAEVNDRTAAAMVSAVFFETGRIAKGLGDIAEVCRLKGVPFFVDAYHALNAVPFSLKDGGLADAFVTGGGYKYCQLGEGNCFLRIPPDCGLRPVVTGWFADFAALERPRGNDPVSYGAGGMRFAGSTYDPVSHYRAAEVFDFFSEQGMTPELLRRISLRQIGLLRARFDALDVDPKFISRDLSLAPEDTGGFLALRSPHAAKLCAELKARGVVTDHRGEILRFGPAPYLSDAQLEAAMGALGEVWACGR